GRYLRSPLWQPLPKGVTNALEGAKPGGLLFSVHPLGGCPMGDNVQTGVVDHMGRVFDPATDGGFHEGLLVLDGSIIPTALGINPLLTITALSERAIELYSQGRFTKKPQPVQPKALPALPNIKPAVIAPRAITGIQFEERMTGNLALDSRPATLEAELTVTFDPVGDMSELLQKPFCPRDVNGTLRVRKLADEKSKQPLAKSEQAVNVKGKVK